MPGSDCARGHCRNSLGSSAAPRGRPHRHPRCVDPEGKATCSLPHTSRGAGMPRHSEGQGTISSKHTGPAPAHVRCPVAVCRPGPPAWRAPLPCRGPSAHCAPSHPGCTCPSPKSVAERGPGRTACGPSACHRGVRSPPPGTRVLRSLHTLVSCFLPKAQLSVPSPCFSPFYSSSSGAPNAQLLPPPPGANAMYT